MEHVSGSTMDRQKSSNDHRITNVVGTTRSILQQIGLGTSTYLDSVSFKSSDLNSQSSDDLPKVAKISGRSGWVRFLVLRWA